MSLNASSPKFAPFVATDFADASAVNLTLSALSAADRLRWAFHHFGSRAAIGTSFQPAGVAILHLAQVNGLALPAFTLDTGLLFPETLKLKADLEARLGIKVESLRPLHSVEEQGRIFGTELWQRDPDLCCQMRKVLPLHERLFFSDCWITGLRRDQSRTRATAPIAEVFKIPNTDRRLWKLNVLADWSRDEVWGYLKDNQLPYNPLHDRGYRSIGCSTCTRATLEAKMNAPVAGVDPRSPSAVCTRTAAAFNFADSSLLRRRLSRHGSPFEARAPERLSLSRSVPHVQAPVHAVVDGQGLQRPYLAREKSLPRKKSRFRFSTSTRPTSFRRCTSFATGRRSTTTSI